MEELPYLTTPNKFLPWQRDFYESTKQFNFLCASNQCGKSVIAIRKCLSLCLDRKWFEGEKAVWKTKPEIILYLLPSQEDIEDFHSIKIKPCLPKGEMKTDEWFGWKEVKDSGKVKGVLFNNGCLLKYASYSRVYSIQSRTVHAVFFDEEPPESFIPEIVARTQSIKSTKFNEKNSPGGLIHFVFTATRGQDFFRRIIEVRGKDELYPVKQGNVWKKQVSLYDCLSFEDGSPGTYTEEEIDNLKKNYAHKREIDRRIYGKFVFDSNLLYEAFNGELNVTNVRPRMPFQIFAGLDKGSGGGGRRSNSAIVLVAVDPEYRFATVLFSWKSQGELVTSQDVIEKYEEIQNQFPIERAYYDYGAKDLYIIGSRRGLTLLKAQKNRRVGESLINSLFKTGQLKIYTGPGCGNNEQLINEILTCSSKLRKDFRNDDLSDGLLYAIEQLPFEFLEEGETGDSEPAPITVNGQRWVRIFGRNEPVDEFEESIDEWKHLYS